MEKDDELIRLAKAAYEHSYAPYSHYPVGAAAIFSSGSIYTGCNVENASFGLTICAERNAIFQAAACGERELIAIAIAVPGNSLPAPCGACRQVMREFCRDCKVILVNGRGQTKVSSLQVLLPDSFGPDSIR